MGKREICFVKQAVQTTKDWDSYQSILRKVFKMMDSANKLETSTKLIMKSVILFLVVGFMLAGSGHQAQAMTRTLKKEPAVVLAAFGTTTKARVTYDFFDNQLKTELPDKYKYLEVRWAFTSEIVRERANKKFKEAGLETRYRSLAQVLANLEDEGYRKIIVQPLHIFPGQEYENVEKTVLAFEMIGLDIKLGGTLLHEWPYVFEAIGQLESEFLSKDQGCNVLVAHGTPETFPGSNSTYLGLDRHLNYAYPNVYIGGVDGVLTREQALARAKQCIPKRVRLIPFMYVAGDHIMNDIMGSEIADDDISWSMELQKNGSKVDSVEFNYQGQNLYKGLGFYPGINKMFIKQIVENLER